MFSLLLAIIYIAFISLGLPDSLLGSAWPIIREEFSSPISYVGIISMIISVFTIISSLSQFERDVLAERTAEGLKAARARGRFGGRPKTESDKLNKAIALYKTKEYTITEITELTGVSKSTLYRAIKG